VQGRQQYAGFMDQSFDTIHSAANDKLNLSSIKTAAPT